MLQFVAVWYSVLQCGAACRSWKGLTGIFKRFVSVLQCGAVWYGVLRLDVCGKDFEEIC